MSTYRTLRALRSLLVAGLCIVLTGCFEIDTLVTVNADGRGTVRERMLLKGALAEMLQKLGANGDAVTSGDDLEARARAMGPGVRLASRTALPPKQGIGHETVFAFTDVNTLRVDQSPRAPGPDGAAGADLATNAHATFRLTPGPNLTLTVFTGQQRNPAGGSKPGAPSGKGAPRRSGELAPEALKSLLGDIRVSFAVAVEGTIIATDASFQEGNHVTLIELDFGKLLEAPEGLAALEDLSGSDLATVKKALERFPGVKVELEPVITITFQPLLRQVRRDAQRGAVAHQAVANVPDRPGDAPG